MIKRKQEAQETLLEGMNLTADVVKSTLGAKGKTVMIYDKLRLRHAVTKDGVTVANSVSFDDDSLNLGSEFIKEATSKTVKEAGDGTTTTAVLVQSMCNDLYKTSKLGSDMNSYISDLKEDLVKVKKYISEKSKKVKTTDDVENIARTSSNNNFEIGKLIKNIYDASNMDVEIDVVEGDQDEDSFEIVNGYSIPNTGYISSIFINNREKGRVEYENPKVYILNGKVKTLSNDLMEIISKTADRNSESFSPTVIIVEDMEETPLREIIEAYRDGAIHGVTIVRSDLIYEDRRNRLIDASKVLDSEYSEDRFVEFGTCEKIIIDRDTTTIINGKGDTSKHLKSLKESLLKTPNNIGLKSRVFALETMAAVIKVGGRVTSEISEKKDRIDDAVLAVKSAIEEGYCPGGSSVFLFASDELDLKTEVMKNALKKCYVQLMLNAGLEPYYYLSKIQDKGFGFGFDLIDSSVSDMYDKGIFDSSKVLRISLENAVSTSVTFVNIETLIY